MCDQARRDRYASARRDPYQFLAQHHKMHPDDDANVLRKKFGEFATATGPAFGTVTGNRMVEDALSAFRAQKPLPEFVLQAASG